MENFGRVLIIYCKFFQLFGRGKTCLCISSMVCCLVSTAL